MKSFGELFEEGVVAAGRKDDDDPNMGRFIDAHISGITGVWVAAANQTECPEWFLWAHYADESRMLRGAIAWNRNSPAALIRIMQRTETDWYVKAAFKFAGVS